MVKLEDYAPKWDFHDVTLKQISRSPNRLRAIRSKAIAAGKHGVRLVMTKRESAPIKVLALVDAAVQHVYEDVFQVVKMKDGQALVRIRLPNTRI